MSIECDSLPEVLVMIVEKTNEELQNDAQKSTPSSVVLMQTIIVRSNQAIRFAALSTANLVSPRSGYTGQQTYRPARCWHWSIIVWMEEPIQITSCLYALAEIRFWQNKMRDDTLPNVCSVLIGPCVIRKLIGRRFRACPLHLKVTIWNIDTKYF